MQELNHRVKTHGEINLNNYILRISNSGNPFPEDISLHNTETLGLRLISIIVEQLKGTIYLEKSPNPRFTIRFPVEKP